MSQIASHWYGTAGSRKPRIIIVGEAWGAEEAKTQQPFVGQSGRELFRMLGEALPQTKAQRTLLIEALSARGMGQWLAYRQRWLEEMGILLANTVAAQPPGNNYTHFLYSNEEAKKNGHPAFHGVYPKPQLRDGIDRLYSLLAATTPDILVAAGNWPFHLLSSQTKPKTTDGFKLPTGIASWAGSQTFADRAQAEIDRRNQLQAQRNGGLAQPYRDQDQILSYSPLPLLPIIHPAAILHDWGMRHVTVHDLRSRLGRFLTGSLSWKAPPTNDLPKPTFDQVKHWFDTWLRKLNGGELWLSVDIETYQKKFITCVGCCDYDVALCIPLFYFDSSKRAINYWTLEQEIYIWETLRTILEHPNVRIIGQNFIYDTQYFSRYYHIDALVSGDTMVGHHLAYPGTPKSLEMLARLYNHHYVYWKDESEEWAADEVSAEDLWRYNCIDIRRTFEAWINIFKVLQAEGLLELYKDRLEQWELGRAMTLQGVNQDAALRSSFIRKLYEQLRPLEDWMLGAVPEAWRYTQKRAPWFTSPHATAGLLYTALGLRPELHKKTKRPTTDDDALHALCERKDTQWLAPLLHRLRDWRSAQVFKNNFLEIQLDPSGRWPMQTNTAHPESFRWSTVKNAFDEGSNMQNLPKVED